jgi:uncharacterized protein YifN (PemK superfamily)
MIVVKYEIERIDAAGVATYTHLGSETHEDIEEVLLPNNPTQNDPIFFTKKFRGNSEYRWEVQSMAEDATAAHRTYTVKLRRRSQVPKKYYLKNILAAQAQNAAHVLHPWCLVEVEFGHSLAVGKQNGNLGSSKRYADTVQLLSMPKRRLAIVLQVHLGRNELVQVIPITSKAPRVGDNSAVEVTSSLINMEHYQKPSWAVCSMVQTVTASRIMAPSLKSKPHAVRDTRFRTLVRGNVRDNLKDAIMYGVAAPGRIAAARDLAEKLIENKDLKTENATLEGKIALLESKIDLYEKYCAEGKITYQDLLDIYTS